MRRPACLPSLLSLPTFLVLALGILMPASLAQDTRRAKDPPGGRNETPPTARPPKKEGEKERGPGNPTEPGTPPTTGSGTSGGVTSNAPGQVYPIQEDRLTYQSTWQRWWDRNQDSFLRAPSLEPDRYPGVPEHLLDATWRRQRRDELRSDVQQVLIGLLDHKEEPVRAAAATSLGQAGIGGGMEELRRLLTDRNATVREAALLGLALGEGSPGPYHVLRLVAGVPDSLRGMKSWDQERLRVLAALFLGLSQDQVLMPYLRDLVEDRRLVQQYRALAIHALGLQGDSSALTVLQDLARTRGEPTLVRCAAVDSLGRIGDPAASETVLRLLSQRDPDAEVRVSAALAAGRLAEPDDREALRTLERTLQRDANLLVRSFALLSLGRLGGPAAEVILVERLRDSRGDDQYFAALGLGILTRLHLTTTAPGRLLHHWREARTQEERRALLAAMGLSGHPAMLEELTHQLRAGDAPVLRRTAAEALKVHGSPEALAALRDAAERESDPVVFRAVALAMGQIDPTATRHLVRCLTRKDRKTSIVRVPLILGLGLCHDPQALPILMDLVQSRDITSAEREAATWALGMAYSPAPHAPLAAIGFASNFLREPGDVAQLLLRLP